MIESIGSQSFLANENIKICWLCMTVSLSHLSIGFSKLPIETRHVLLSKTRMFSDNSITIHAKIVIEQFVSISFTSTYHNHFNKNFEPELRGRGFSVFTRASRWDSMVDMMCEYVANTCGAAYLCQLQCAAERS